MGGACGWGWNGCEGELRGDRGGGVWSLRSGQGGSGASWIVGTRVGVSPSVDVEEGGPGVGKLDEHLTV